MAKLINKSSDAVVKLINVASIGPVLAVLQMDSADAISVSNPCQLGSDENGDLIIRDYLDGISDNSEHTVFMKSNIISVSEPVKSLADVYLEAIAEFESETTSQILVPSQKIVL